MASSGGGRPALAAAIIHVTSRRLRPLAHEADPPPCGPTGYDAQAFVAWATRRAEKGRDFLAERIRLTKAQADKAEIEGAALRDDLLPMADAPLHRSRRWSPRRVRACCVCRLRSPSAWPIHRSGERSHVRPCAS